MDGRWVAEAEGTRAGRDQGMHEQHQQSLWPIEPEAEIQAHTAPGIQGRTPLTRRWMSRIRCRCAAASPSAPFASSSLQPADARSGLPSGHDGPCQGVLWACQRAYEIGLRSDGALLVLLGGGGPPPPPLNPRAKKQKKTGGPPPRGLGFFFPPPGLGAQHSGGTSRPRKLAGRVVVRVLQQSGEVVALSSVQWKHSAPRVPGSSPHRRH